MIGRLLLPELIDTVRCNPLSNGIKMNKNIKSRYGTYLNVPKSTTTNAAGGAAYNLPDEENVLKMLMVGTSSDLFYTDAMTNIDEAVKCFMNENIGPDFLSKAIVHARNEGFNREMPVLGLCALSVRDVNAFKEICPEVLKNPHDWEMFIDICRSGKIRKGMGRAVKTTMIKNLADMSAYHTMKYPTAVLDMVNICRPHPNAAPISLYIKNKDWESAIDELGCGADFREKYKPLYALKRAQDLAKSKDNVDYHAIAHGIRECGLPYEVMTSVIGKNEECWKALYDTAPYFNMIRNLNNFIKYGAIDNTNVSDAARRIASADAVHKSMLYPFRFYQAWKNVANDRGGNLSDSGLGVLKFGLEEAIQHSLDNVPSLPGITCVATDVSGSMRSAVNSNLTDITCAEIAGIFSAILYLKNKGSTIMLPFDYVVRYDMIQDMVKGKSVQEIASVFKPGGGTSLAAPMTALMNQRVKVDTFIGITDNMEWLGSGYNIFGASRDGMFIDAFKAYQRAVNPDVKAYLITLQPYSGAPAPSTEKNIKLIYGWNDSVLKYIGMDQTQSERFASLRGKD